MQLIPKCMENATLQVCYVSEWHMSNKMMVQFVQLSLRLQRTYETLANQPILTCYATKKLQQYLRSSLSLLPNQVCGDARKEDLFLWVYVYVFVKLSWPSSPSLFNTPTFRPPSLPLSLWVVLHWLSKELDQWSWYKSEFDVND